MIGRTQVTDPKELNHRFNEVLDRLAVGGISHHKAAKDLKIDYATLKRLLNNQGTPPAGKTV